MIVDINNLYKSYQNGNKRYEILKDINLNIEEKEIVIIQGISGSGKSTLLSIIAGMEKPTSGKLEVLGEPIAKLPDIHISHFRASKIGMVFQHFNLIENLTVADNIMLPLSPLKLSLKEAKEYAKRAMKLSNIISLQDKEVKFLSGGEKQRVAIARAIVAKPKLLLCDEPTANLDRDNANIFLELIEILNKEGITIIIATHDPIFSNLNIQKRVIKIEQGQLIDE